MRILGALLAGGKSTRFGSDKALAEWGEDPDNARLVIHGQVIPAAMRASDMVEWIGFAHGEDDPWAVPAWWRLRSA